MTLKCIESHDIRNTTMFMHQHKDLKLNAFLHGQPVQLVLHIVRYKTTLTNPQISQSAAFKTAQS